MMTLRERLSKKAEMTRSPLISAFELLPTCNLQCRMCYVRKSPAQVRAAGGLKDAQWWLAHARQARDCGLLYPLLTGGEPFLYPELYTLLGGLAELGMQTSINSNATLIDQAAMERLRQAPPIRVNVTMYGGSAQAYQALCGDGDAFYRMRQGARLLKENGIGLKFNASITPENVQDIPQIVAFAKELDTPLQVVTYMFPPIRRDSTLVGQNDRLSPEEAARARVYADYLQNEPQWFVNQAARYGRFVPLEKLDFEELGHQPGGMTCRAGVCSYWVDWQGNLSNCGMFGSVTVPMEGRPFREAWQELVEKNAALRYDPPCTRCPNRRLCHPCVAMIRNECGDYSGRPEYVCQMNQALSRIYGEYAARYYPDLRPDGPKPEAKQDDCIL